MDALGSELTKLRAEVARLRSENARLARLLDLEGQDTTPAEEQLAVSGAQGILSMSSPTTEKLALYGGLFRARTDVYALRWDNARTGASGWMPAVAGGWRKGIDRQRVRHLPLTAEVLASHLSGEVFIGIYPMLRDNSCWLVAADFDGPGALLDALAYVKAARSQGVPAAVELSQSGRGAHVWIFFTEPIAAATARAVGTALIHEATVLRGTMDLRSYDRLFPNQDVLPAGGFGNLIAAPLQGRRRQHGLTVFLDPGTLEPHDDQWLYLSTLDRLDPRMANEVARRATRVTVGTQVSTMSTATATRIRPPLPAVVHAELRSGLTVRTAELTAAAVSTFKHAASMANPKFYELQRLRKSTWDTPRYVRGYDVTIDDDLVLPRGLRHVVRDMIEKSGSRLALTDLRNAGHEVNVELAGELSDRQASAVSAMLAYDDGVLVAPPGSGKTVMACAMIAERATSTLILLDRKALAEQWRERVERFLGIRPGQLGGGRRKLSGTVDIAMLPTLARRDDIEEITEPYGQVIVDECHHLGAASYDHAVKQIGAQFWLGLTATPQRRDGLGELITWQLGPVRHTVTNEMPGTLTADLDSSAVAHRELRIHETSFAAEIDLADSAALAATQLALAVDDARNDQIVADVLDALRMGRNCLILTRRVAQLRELDRRLAAAGFEPMILQGGLSVDERRRVTARLADAQPGDGVLLLGTTPFIGEGFDAPALDTLFLAGPISFDGLLLQCVGRVLRTCPGKSDAIVHDYHDVKTTWLAAALRRRMPGYRALGFAPSR